MPLDPSVLLSHSNVLSTNLNVISLDSDVLSSSPYVITNISLKEGVLKSWLENFMSGALNFFWCVVLALLVWFIGVKVTKWIRKLIQKAMQRRDVDTGVRQFTDAVIKWACYILLAVIILNLFGVQTSSVAAGVASLGVTAGLAFQGALSNLAGGILILVIKPFKVGDYIKEDTHNNEGTVAEISIFYTTLNTIDNRRIVIPNGTLANASLTNYTAEKERQIDMTFPIGYNDDIQQAKKILEQMAQQTKERVSDKPANVFVRELGDSSINLGLRFWVPADDFWPVTWRLNEEVKSQFDQAGISIPYNQTDVHIINQENSAD